MRRRAFLLLLALVASAGAAWGEAGSGAPTLERRALQVNGVERVYHLCLPATLPADTPVPLLLVFHGRGGNGLAFGQQSGFPELAERERFIVAFPDGLNRKWMDGDPNLDPLYQNDIPFAEAVVDALSKERKVDPARVYAVGFSNGAAFAQILAIRSGRFAAIGSAGAGLATTYLDPLTSARPFSIILSCGTEDPFCEKPARPDGSLAFPYLMRVAPTLDALPKLTGCAATPREEDMPDTDPEDGCRVRRSEWIGGREHTGIVLLRVQGGKHGWYRSGPGSRTQCRDIDIPTLFWEFLAAHPRQGASAPAAR